MQAQEGCQAGSTHRAAAACSQLGQQRAQRPGGGAWQVPQRGHAGRARLGAAQARGLRRKRGCLRHHQAGGSQPARGAEQVRQQAQRRQEQPGREHEAPGRRRRCHDCGQPGGSTDGLPPQHIVGQQAVGEQHGCWLAFSPLARSCLRAGSGSGGAAAGGQGEQAGLQRIGCTPRWLCALAAGCQGRAGGTQCSPSSFWLRERAPIACQRSRLHRVL